MQAAQLVAMGRRLVGKGWKLATAESCTGGLVAHWITTLPGCSAWYQGGVVAYANSTKIALLGVSKALLEAEGAVSRAVAVAMAQGACREIPDTHIAVGITGIAGPAGGTATKPVGCVYVALADVDGTCVASHLTMRGSRAEIQIAAGKAALQMVYDHLCANKFPQDITQE